MKTVRLSCAHALFKFLIAQKTIIDGKKVALFPGAFAIYGHGNVACLGQAMEEFQSDLPGYRGHHEQSMALSGIGYARAMRRKQIFIATSSSGPGAMNMVTAAGVALSNRLPLLLLPGDVFASRFPDPVLQQVENFNSPVENQNDAFKPVSRFFDRITRPEQILNSLPQAIQIMLDPADCGPATIAISQDVQGESFDYPEVFFEERVHEIRRIHPDPSQIKAAVEKIKASKQPIIISGGGVLYSEAEEELSQFAKKHNIPVTATAMGIGCMTKEESHYIGGIGGLGEKSANNLSKETDLALAIGTKLADFTTGSWANFESDRFQLVSLNAARFDTTKHLATPIVADAKIGLQQLSQALGDWRAPDPWFERAVQERTEWETHVQKQSGPTIKKSLLMPMRLERFTETLIRVILLLQQQAGSLEKWCKFGNPNKETRLRRSGDFLVWAMRLVERWELKWLNPIKTLLVFLAMVFTCLGIVIFTAPFSKIKN